MAIRITITVTFAILEAYSRLCALACRLLFLGKRRNELKTRERKEQQVCQHSRSLQSSTAIHSKFPPNGSGEDKPALVSGLRAMMPRNCTPAGANLPRTDYGNSFLGKRSSYERLIRWIAGDWFVRFTLAGKILPIIFQITSSEMTL
ncbi:MAG: hypothetical protein CVU57_24115 [Deltaproteobacteria bacterium HGW-Deltaproteobacteria-15]|nr:MAG: hypothetical protein CVU57_24115 [Deltaproteobacteria bacterium HGW-Deltaproteobacteria-15]